MNGYAIPGLNSQELMVAALKTPFGALIANPWFDQLALRVLSRWFFPVSRMWAAAGASQGSVERFFAEVQIAPEQRLACRLKRRLQKFEEARSNMLTSNRRWEDAFFGSASEASAQLAGIEEQRLFDKNDYNMQRRGFLSLGLADTIAPIRWDIPRPDAVADIYLSLATDLPRAFAVPDPMPKVTMSRVLTEDFSRDYWLRFDTPSARLGDQVVARVHEPAGISNPPTLIFGHGICVEFDHWRGLVDEVEALVAMGIRVVRPEAPWHGRRVPNGLYAGEQFMATAPLGALDLFTSAAREWAVLIDWCRNTTNGPVCIGGSSLGAMTAQLIATKAHSWPERLRPDAMLLITHCGHIHDAVVEGALAKVWKIEQATMANGWNSDLIARYLPLIDPTGKPAVATENIISVLGECDEVTPFHSAKELIEDWGIPDGNVFITRHGHFSVPLAMMRNHAPLLRFREVLDRLSS